LIDVYPQVAHSNVQRSFQFDSKANEIRFRWPLVSLSDKGRKNSREQASPKERLCKRGTAKEAGPVPQN
jgi:hypothetical protein